MSEKRTALIGARIRPSVKQAAEEAAAMEGRTLSNYIERLIEGSRPANNGFTGTIYDGFDGSVVKLSGEEYRAWNMKFSDLPSLKDALTTADEYFVSKPPPNGDWRTPLEKWLTQENEAAQ